MIECYGFVGHTLFASGTVAEVSEAARSQPSGTRIAIYSASSGHVIEMQTSDNTSDELRPRGRPKLGVQSREVSLLPRHWQWLSDQGRSASATLRRLIDEARTRDQYASDSIGAAHQFLWDIGGDLPHFEEATRALFARDFKLLARHVTDWPAGIVDALRGYLPSLATS